MTDGLMNHTFAHMLRASAEDLTRKAVKLMRDRLIKLLQDNSYLDVLDDEHWLLAAEQLLANGVVVIDADVVPKSEVEELIKSVDDMLDLVCAMTGLELTYFGKYAELKKKYIKGD
jgi:hypothetical protein